MCGGHACHYMPDLDRPLCPKEVHRGMPAISYYVVMTSLSSLSYKITMFPYEAVARLTRQRTVLAA